MVAGDLEDLGVGVDSEKPGGRATGREDCRGVATGADGGVDVDTARPRLQQLDHRLEEDGHVYLVGHLHPMDSKFGVLTVKVSRR
jgi:hypothetical protein